MTFNNHTQKSLEAVQSAQNIAVQHSNQQLEQIHLLVALLQQDGGLTPQLLRKMGITTESIEAAAKAEVQKLPAVTGSRDAARFYISPAMDATFRTAEQQAQRMKDDYISVEHLLLALIEAAEGDMTSVSVCVDLRLVAVALQAEDYDAAGDVVILNTDGEMLAMIEAGFQPDMETFTPDGTKILVANEGEPRNGYGEDIIDPLGSVTIIWLNSEDPASSAHRNVGFEEFDEKREELVASGIMLTKGNLPSADLEPEYIACDNDTAYITLQEANAVAILDLVSGTYRGVYSGSCGTCQYLDGYPCGNCSYGCCCCICSDQEKVKTIRLTLICQPDFTLQ